MMYRYLWEFAPMSNEEWQSVLDPHTWQLFITKDRFESAPMVITERTR